MFIFYEKQNLLIGDISTVKIHFISFGRRTFLAINSVIQVNNFEEVSFEKLYFIEKFDRLFYTTLEYSN